MQDLPDFDDIYLLVDRQRDVAISIGKLREQIRNEESKLVEKLTTDSKFFINQKPPSVAMMEKRWLPTGLNGTLGSLRFELDVNLAEMEHLKNKLDIVKYQIDIWRTQQADKRGATY